MPLCLELVSFFQFTNSGIIITSRLKLTCISQDLAHTSANFDHFTYANVTVCGDATVCPFPNNRTCCDQGKGRAEINFHNDAVIPSALSQLSPYYTLAGYSIAASTTGGSSETSPGRSTSPAGAPSSRTFSTGASPIGISTQNTSATRTSAAKATDVSPGISHGGKIGLGVGIGIGAAILISTVFFFCRRHRKHAKSDGTPQMEGITPKLMTTSVMVVELHGESMKPELDSAHGVHELRS